MVAPKNLLPSTSLTTTRGFLTLTLLPLFLVAVGGVFIYLNISAQAEKEALTHTQNIAKLLSSQTSAFIRSKTHSVQLMAGEAEVLKYIQNNNASQTTPNPVLKRYCDTLAASICYLMNKEGVAVADNREAHNSIVGNNYGFRPYFKNAIGGFSSIHLALGVTTKKRGIYFSSPVFIEGKLLGVAVIKFPPNQIEENFKGLSGQASLVDGNGIIFASSTPDWLYKSLFPLSVSQRQRITDSRQFGETTPEDIGLQTQTSGHVSNKLGEEFLIEQAGIDGLPGWNITYLLAPKHFSTPEQSRDQTLASIALLALFLFVLVVVGKLFRSLKSAMHQNREYQVQLEESTDRLQRFEEVANEALVIHNGSNILDVNKRSEELFEYSREELLTMQPGDLFSSVSLDYALNMIASGSEKPYQSAITTKQGDERPVEITGRPILWKEQQLRMASFRDISRRLAVQKRLSASEDRFRQLSDLVAEGILIHAQGIIVDANESFCNIIGERKEDLIDKPLGHLFPNDIVSQFLNEDINPAEKELTLPRRDETYFPAEVSSASMQFDDGLYSVISIRDISRQKEQEEHILYQAQYDLLTHVPNRFLARDRAEHAMKSATQHQHKMALMFIDLDGFKKVNDSLGHDVGDRLLQQAARRFQNCIKESDTLARHGGDEFLILLESIDQSVEVEQTIEKVLQQFSLPFSIDSKELIVTCSIGVAVYPDDAKDYQSLLRAADIGMYKAKKDGKNTFHFYTQEMNDIATRQLLLDNNLRYAMDRNEFSLAFQPLVSGNEARIVGAEALLRWNSDTLGSVSPAEFIPLTEQTGLIIVIGRWVLEQACVQAKRWIDAGAENFSLSVNVSPRQFKGNNFVTDLQHALCSSGLPPKHLNIEVTEGLLIQASPELNKTLQEITEMGVKISMDDFGTGYSSLSYLKTFPFNNLKIDRAFIRELPSNPDSNILVSATIAMAHKLGLSVTAEGIETEEQFQYLRNTDCDLLQGFYFGKPIPAAEFTKKLEGSVTATTS